MSLGKAVFPEEVVCCLVVEVTCELLQGRWLHPAWLCHPEVTLCSTSVSVHTLSGLRCDFYVPAAEGFDTASACRAVTAEGLKVRRGDSARLPRS